MAAFGVFGKIPCIADFIQFGLPVDFIQAWDGWLQAGIVATQTRLGETWADCYNSAPIWRFSLPPGMAGAAAILGVLMPSVDRVGRRFPLTVAVPLPKGASHVAEHLRSGEVLSSIEDIALESLDGSMSPSQLQARLSSLSPVEPSLVRHRTVGDTQFVQRTGGICALPDLVGSRSGAARESLWCAETAAVSHAFAAPDLGSELLGLLLNPFPDRSRSGVPA